ncbi:hypothetical protein CYMTET_29696, partial [Cymbomonas tetramitiformis]
MSYHQVMAKFDRLDDKEKRMKRYFTPLTAKKKGDSREKLVGRHRFVEHLEEDETYEVVLEDMRRARSAAEQKRRETADGSSSVRINIDTVVTMVETNITT